VLKHKFHQQIEALIVASIYCYLHLILAEKVEENRRLCQVLGIEQFHFRHFEDLLKHVELVLAQVVNQVPVVVAKNRPKHPWQLKLRDLDASIG
jgi:hypothetical protein